MKNLIILIFLLPFILQSQIYYVAHDGDDAAVGDLTHPWKTFQKAFDEVAAGDTVYFRAGVYDSYARSELTTSGTIGNRIVFEGYPTDIAAGNFPILDCKVHCDSIPDTGWDIYNYAIKLEEVEYITLKCLEIRNVYQCDSILTGAISAYNTSNITYERITIHNVGHRGYWHQSGAWNYADSAYAVDVRGANPADASTIFTQPDTTRWINCDVYNCMDTLRTVGNRGNGGDAWKVISYIGNYYLWEGCRAWNYSDDGFDPNGGERILKNCWAMASNKYSAFDGFEGNGFKTSSERTVMLAYFTPADYAAIALDSMVRAYNCLAIFSPGRGFYHGLETDTTINPRWYNNTAYECGFGFASQSFGLDSIGDVFKNNIAYGSTKVTATSVPYEVSIMNNSTYAMKYCLDSNTWINKTGYPCFEYNPTYTVTDADFATVDSATLISLFTASRQSDGSLPTNRPMMLASTSDLIGGAWDVGYGSDLGYIDYAAAAGSPPVTDFSADRVSITRKQHVTFTDESTNTPTSWAWTFEGGTPSTSILESPVVQYNNTGTFNVTLTATNGDGYDSEQKVDYIEVNWAVTITTR